MVKSNYSGTFEAFTKKVLVFLSTLFLDLQKMALCCSHGLVTFDLKIRCEVGRSWRCVAVGSGEHGRNG